MQSAFDEESKQKAGLSKELEKIRIELNQSNEEKYKYQAQINVLIEENNRFRNFSGKSESEVESMTNKAKALEVDMWSLFSCLFQIFSFCFLVLKHNEICFREVTVFRLSKLKVYFSSLML